MSHAVKGQLNADPFSNFPLRSVSYRAGQFRILAWQGANTDRPAPYEVDHGTWLWPCPMRSMIVIVTSPSSSGREMSTLSDDSTCLP